MSIDWRCWAARWRSWSTLFSVIYVMVVQAISGIAKNLNNMSAKSAIKTVVPESTDQTGDRQQQLFKWVAILTGSKNALKGVGFFLGGVLLTALGFNQAVGSMAAGLSLAFLLTLLLPRELGKMKRNFRRHPSSKRGGPLAPPTRSYFARGW